MADATRDIEVLATGTHAGVEVTGDDLDQLAENFTTLGPHIKPPVKLGHTEQQLLAQADGQPALGWVTALKRQGEKLVATVKGIPQRFAELIDKGRYRRVSSEFYPAWHVTESEKNLQTGVQGKVLKAVSFLGADVPVVKNLDDLATFLGAEQPGVTVLAEPTEDAVTVTVPAADADRRALVAELTEAVMLAIAQRADVATHPTPPYGDVPYADATNKKYPIDTEEHIRAAWNYIHKAANAAKYGAKDVAAIKGRIAAAWRAKIDKNGPPSAMSEVGSHAQETPMADTEDQAATLAELTAKLAEKDAQLAAELQKRDAEIARLAEATKLAEERQRVADRKARLAEAKEWVDSRACAGNLRLFGAQKAASTALLAECLESDAAVVTLAENGAETKVSLADAFRRIVDAYPPQETLLREVTRATQPPTGDDPLAAITALAEKQGKDPTDPQVRAEMSRQIGRDRERTAKLARLGA